MTIAAASTAARSVFRSSATRSAASRLASQAKPARSSPFRLPSRTPLLAHRIFRSPAEMSACLQSMQPYHTATASALLTSMLNVSRCGFGWLPEGTHPILLSILLSAIVGRRKDLLVSSDVCSALFCCPFLLPYFRL